MIGKAIGSRGYPLPNIGPNNQVARLALSGGPGFIADAFDIDPAADYPLSNLYPLGSPSPSATWRSIGTTEEIPLAWDNTHTTRFGDSIAVAVFNCNFPTAVLEGKDGGGAWTALATLDMAVDFTDVEFDREGDMVFPSVAAGTQGSRYLWRDELAGATVDLGSSKFRKVRKNTAGQWLSGTTATTRKCRLWLDGIDGTEGTTTGTCSIWARHAVAIVHNAGNYDQFRLRIPTGSNADGYWEIGTVIIGGLAIVGKQHDWGWAWKRDLNARTTTNEAGTTFARRKGQGPRSLSMSWNSGHDLGDIRNNPASGLDYLAADSGNPLATVDDVGHFLSGLFEEINSGATPVVVLPSIPSTNTVLTDPWDFLLARPGGGVQFDNVVGDERVDEMYRTGSINWEEII